MIIHKDGDLLKSGCDILCHQVNCQGVMGSGIALQVRNEFPSTYAKYLEMCKNDSPEKLLGKVLCTEENSGKTYIANMFGQLNYGNGVVQTDYDALRNGFLEVSKKAESLKNKKEKIRVGIPYRIGCCRGGGDWKIVCEIIVDVFAKSNNVDLEIWKKKG